MKDFPSYGVKNKTHRLVRQKPVNESRSFVQVLIMGFILAVIALFFIQQRIEYIDTQRRVERLSLEKRKLTAEILPLKIEEQYLSKLDIVEDISKKEFQLRFPEERQIIKQKIITTPEK